MKEEKKGKRGRKEKKGDPFRNEMHEKKQLKMILTVDK